MAHSVCLNVATGAGRDSTSLDVIVVAAAADEFVNYIVVVGNVIGQFPTPVLVLNRTYGTGKLDTFVVEAAHVAGDFVLEVGTCRNEYGVDEVRGLTIIVIDVEDDAVLQETEVQTCIEGLGLFPCKIGVVSVRTIGAAVAVHTDGIVGVVAVEGVRGKIGIVANAFLLTCDTVAHTGFEVADGFNILKEALFLY